MDEQIYGCVDVLKYGFYISTLSQCHYLCPNTHTHTHTPERRIDHIRFRPLFHQSSSAIIQIVHQTDRHISRTTSNLHKSNLHIIIFGYGFHGPTSIGVNLRRSHASDGGRGRLRGRRLSGRLCLSVCLAVRQSGSQLVTPTVIMSVRSFQSFNQSGYLSVYLSAYICTYLYSFSVCFSCKSFSPILL